MKIFVTGISGFIGSNLIKYLKKSNYEILGISRKKISFPNIQILQGDGALIMIFSLAIIGMLLWHYRDKAKKAEKVAEILAQEIASKKDPELEDKIFLAARHTNVEANVYHLMVKVQKKDN